MNVTSAIPNDELMLARLACSKLIGMVQGVTSAGLASFELGSSAEFFAGRVKTISAFIEVLRCIGIKPGSGRAVEVLRENAEQLSRLADQYFEHFIRLAQWPSMADEDVQELAGRLASSYVSLLESLQAFSQLLEMELDCPIDKQQWRQMIERFFKEFCTH